MKRGIFFAFLSAVIVGTTALVLVVLAFARPESFRQALFSSRLPGLPLFGRDNGRTNAEIVAQANHGVVTVIASRALRPNNLAPASDPTPPADNNIQRGTGTGFIIDASGIVVTNEHVIKDADRIRVKLADGRERRAIVQGTDSATDLAILKIEADGLTVLPLGDSDSVRVGDPVIAIGNPLEYEHSVTAGIVSAKGRKVYNLNQRPYEDFIQTDAAINRGNSGGPLFNRAGEVIGVNTVIRIDGRGISFAVPSNVVKQVVAQLRSYGFVARGYLGVTPENLTPEFRDGLGLTGTHGVLVSDVSPDTPAARAGLQAYDVITHFEGRAVQTKDDFFALVAGKLPLQQVEIDIMRGGQPMKLRATLDQRDDLANSQPRETRPVTEKKGLALGFSVREATPETLRELSTNNAGNTRESVISGAVVADVDPLGPAAGLLSAGQFIIEANRQPIRHAADFERLAASLHDGEALILRIASANRQERRLIALRVGEGQ